MPCDDCLNRRDFFAKSALAAATLVIAEACGDGQIGPVIPHRSGSDPDVPPGGVAPFNISQFPGLATVGVLVDIGHERAIVRTGAMTFRGLSRICTHQGCDTDVVGGRQLVCPCHGSTFDVDGSVIRGPNIPSPPIAPLTLLPVTFDAATGTITIA